MAHPYRLLLLAAGLFGAFQSQAQSVGVGTTTPNANAALDISAGAGNNKGLLVPRMTYAQRTAISTTTQGMLVYQTDDTQPGFWYFQGSVWVPLGIGATSAAQGWLTTGNTGSTPGTFTGVGQSTNGTGGTSFIGTSDNTDLVFRTGNTERLRLTTNGSLYSRSSFGLILNASDAPMITRGWDTFQTGAYTGLGRWGLFMQANRMSLGIPNVTGKSFGWVTWNDNSAVNATLMTLTQTGNLGIGLNGTDATTRLSIVGTGTANPATATANQSTGHLARFRDIGDVALDLGSSGTGSANGNSGIWLQSTNPTNLSTNYPLRLNPNGGNVGIGASTAPPTSALTAAGAVAVPYTTTGTATSFTLDNTHQTVRRLPACTTITLPDASTCMGRLYTIINSSSSGSSVALAVAAGNGIFDDVTNTTITSLPVSQRITIQSDNSGWIVVGI